MNKAHLYGASFLYICQICQDNTSCNVWYNVFMKFTLHTLPITVNRMYGGKRYLTSEGRSSKASIYYEAKRAGCVALDTPITVSIAWYRDSNRRCDVDNILKCLLDALTGVCWFDDTQITELRIIKRIDKKAPRIDVEVTEGTPMIPVKA